MTTLDRYIARTVAAHFGFALAALVAVFSMINAMQELREVGVGEYGALQALWYTLLTAPNEGYRLFPAAALIGGVSALGALAAGNEVVVMWAAGISKGRMMGSVLQVAAALSAAAVIGGELVAAPLAQRAGRERSLALSAGKAMGSAKGLWVRDGVRFVNIRDPSEASVPREIYVYEIGAGQVLERFWYAPRAVYESKRWLAMDVVENLIGDAGVVSERHAEQPWGVSLTPKQIRRISLPPEHLSLAGLWRSGVELARRGENPHRYQLAFWNRAAVPFVTLAMVALAIPLVLTAMRGASFGQRVVLGAVIGVGFQMFTETFSSFGLAYGVPPLLNAMVPLSLAALAAAAGLSRMTG